MTKPEKGDTVRVHYTGRLSDGTEFDSSAGRDPLQFELGAGQIIDGLDREIAGMDEGAKQTVTVPAAEAYGDRRPEQVQELPRSAIPEEINPEPGMQLQATTQAGQPVPIVVTDVSEDTVTVDANHPLAGRDLVFDVELVEVIKAA
ncbi:FKBP-type peptidyl-prolyl cis-trans isomerase [Pararhizobium mangrovi]|uniref:Peptidyl-prolyl cis-trans isomerase n=1 Tax=Pararhizobium mangrovi TaxID=2590452 RepID=A0A506UHU5_9HYPH|nr:peptidylprolyl isomerase [Pararhizobium mangrovi]TPW32886.1 peptidylprolyl isomerase [Pararhizobium mangrovi]